MVDLAIALAVAGASTATLCPWLISSLASHGVVDPMVDRSSHVGTVPRGGGLAIMAGVVLSLAISIWSSRDAIAIAAIIPALFFGILGFVDDLRSLPAKIRLSLQTLLGTAAAWLAYGSGSDASVLTVLVAAVAIVSFVNAFNFMDGINGISVTTTVVIGCSLVLSSFRWEAGVELPALATVGAAIGFAPYNLNGRLFLGDVGSYLVGAMLALLSIIGLKQGIPLLAALMPFGLYLADTGYTLCRRAGARKPLFEAHREHVYQRLTNEAGLGHARVSRIVGALTLILAIAAQVGGGASLAAAALSLSVSMLAIGLYLASPRWVGRTLP